MRVLFLTYPRIGLNRGGLQIQIEETAKALAELGVEVVFYDPWSNQIPDVDLCHVFSIDGSMLSHVQQAVHMGKPVVISSVLNLFQSQPILTRMKVELSRFIPGMYSDLNRASLMMRVASRVIALNDDEQKLLHKVFRLSSERIVIIPNGISHRFGDGDPSLFVQKYGVRDFVLNVASIEKRKNQLSLISAMKDLPYPLVIIGKASSEQESYMSWCRKEAGDNVVFTGGLAHDNPLLASAYAAARLFVLPSYSEVMPLTLYEATVAGCRAAVSQNVPVADSIAPMISTFDPNDIQELAACITREMAQTRNEKLQTAVRLMPSWRHVCGRILSVYEEGLRSPAQC